MASLIATLSAVTTFLKSEKTVSTYFSKNEKVKIDELFNRIILRRFNGKELTKGKRFRNQSMSLFISFLLNKNVIYKDKSYIYNKDKIISQPSIIVS